MPGNAIVRNFKPLELLGAEEVEDLRCGALEVLEETGIQVESRKALDVYARGGCQVDYEHSRVRFPRDLVESSLRQCPSSFTMKARNPDFSMEVGGNNLYFSLFSGMRIVDLDTWEVRTPTVEENHDACKVADCLENVHAATSYTPYCEFVGVPPAMLLPVSCWSRMKYFAKISRIGAAPDSHIWEIQMAQALGVDIYGALEASPPLTFSAGAAECGIACAEAGFPVEPGCGGVMGATHPATLAGALVVGMAECMAGTVLVQIVRPGNPIIVNSFDIPQNMRSGAPAFGAIGISLFQAMWNQVWRQAYNIPTMNGGVGPSSSKAIDYQCGYERTMGIMLSALTGAHVINTVGGLTGELSYHPALSVLDNDLISMIRRFLAGPEVNEDTLALDLIKRTGPIPGFFLGTAHTRKWWRRESVVPQAADWLPYSEWLAGGKKSALDYARERSEQILANYQHTLPADKEAELDRILEDARRYYTAKGMI